jgi:hypothetical protein
VTECSEKNRPILSKIAQYVLSKNRPILSKNRPTEKFLNVKIATKVVKIVP